MSGLTLTELDEEGRPEGSGAAADPSGLRVGVPPPDAAARTLRRTLDDAAAAVHKARLHTALQFAVSLPLLHALPARNAAN